MGPSLCFLIDAATYAVAAWCAYRLKGMLAEEAPAIKALGMARQRPAADSPLKSAVELAAVQPAKLEAVAAPEVLQSSVRFAYTWPSPAVHVLQSSARHTLSVELALSGPQIISLFVIANLPSPSLSSMQLAPLTLCTCPYRQRCWSLCLSRQTRTTSFR